MKRLCRVHLPNQGFLHIKLLAYKCYLINWWSPFSLPLLSNKSDHTFLINSPAISLLCHCYHSSLCCFPTNPQSHLSVGLLVPTFSFLSSGSSHLPTGLPWWPRDKEPTYNAGDMGHTGWSLGGKYPLQKELATHSSILVGKIPG